MQFAHRPAPQNLQNPDAHSFDLLKAVVEQELRLQHVTTYLTSNEYMGPSSPTNHKAPVPKGSLAGLPPFRDMMRRQQFRLFLTAQGWLRYWQCWQDMEDFRLYPFQVPAAPAPAPAPRCARAKSLTACRLPRQTVG